MRRVLPWLATFGVGIALGLLLAPGAPTPVPSSAPVPTTTEVGDVPAGGRSEAPPAGIESVAPPPPEPATLQGRGAASEGGSRPSDPRVTADGRVEVAVIVVLPDGGEAESARVYWAAHRDEPDHSLHRQSWRPGSSVYVQPGNVWIHAAGGPGRVLRSDVVHVRISPDAPLQTIRLVLEDRPAVYGQVVLPGVFERPRLTVYLQRQDAGPPPDQWVRRRSDPHETPNEGEGYTFAFHDLEPGDYRLGLALSGYEIHMFVPVTVDRVSVRQDLAVATFDTPRFMEVRVIGPGGQRLREVQLSLHFQGETASAAGGGATLLREDGTFVVSRSVPRAIREDGSYAEGRYTLSVRAGEHGEMARLYDPRTTDSLTFRLAERESFAIRITGLESIPVGMAARVSVRGAGVRGIQSPRPIPSGGRVDLGHLQPGAYEVVLLLTGSAEVGARLGLRILAVVPVELAPGRDALEVEVPDLHRLVVQVPSAAEDPVFTLRRRWEDGTWSYPATPPGEVGTTRFEHLPAGTYSLEGHYGERYVKRDVQIPEESTVRLD